MDSMFDDTLIISIVIISSIKVLSIAHQQTHRAGLCALWYGLFFAITKVIIPAMLGISVPDNFLAAILTTWGISGIVVFCGLSVIEQANSDGLESVLYIFLGAALVLLIFVI